MRVLIGLIFVVSGVSSLIYQVAWQRILALHSGIGIYSVAVIVAAFLAGLGFGSYAGGIQSARTRPRAALRVFAALELAVGLFAFASCTLYYDLLHLRMQWLFADPWRAGAVHFTVLFLPTALMGMSLPFLVQAMVRRPRSAARTIGYYYGLNVIGAALGALLTPWVFIRLFGIAGAVSIGAVGNLAVGVTALLVGVGSGAPDSPGAPRDVGDEPPPRDAEAEPAGSRPFGLWLFLYGLSGFCALSLEILWFRVLDVAVKSTAFTFGTVLAIFLFGLGLGSLIGGGLAARIDRPLRVFLGCQSALLAYAGLALLLLVTLPVDLPGYRGLVSYWGEYEGFQLGRDWAWDVVLGLYLCLPLFLYGVPTVLMGVSFAALQRAVHDDVRTTGRKVGVLQSGNILGNVAGSLLTGLLFLTVLETPGTMRLLLAVGLVFPVLGFHYYEHSRPAFVAAGLAMAAAAIALPGEHGFWLRLHGSPDGTAFVDEDASAVAAIVPGPERLTLTVNGKVHSWLPFGGVHSRLGAIPALLHPAPRDVAIVGLGSGDTAWAAGCRRETQRVEVFELAAPEERLLRRAAAGFPLRRLARFLDDPRVSIVTADARTALTGRAAGFDLIEADALRPHSAYSGNVYSVEFFRLCAARLEPGGLFCSWAPTPRVHQSFLEAFPHVLEFHGAILVGSREPLAVDPEAWSARLAGARAYLGPGVTADVQQFLGTARRVELDPAGRVRPNRDLFPRDEFRTP